MILNGILIDSIFLKCLISPSIFHSKFVSYRVEWIAYDFHSGLDSIAWRLFDNYTGTDILHGHEDIPAQGMANVNKT
jgi:hypothetical protein